MRFLLLPAALFLTSCSPTSTSTTQPATTARHITETVPNLEAKPATITAFTEGPTADKDGNIYFTEHIHQQILKMAPDGKLTIFRDPSNNANGLVFDTQERLIACESASSNAKSPYFARKSKSRVTRTTLLTGEIEVLADNYQGQPFDGPNDVTYDSKDRLYFTDLPGGAVYRIDPDKKLTRLLTRPEIQRPNGIAISPDDKTLYLVEANQAEGGARLLRAYDLRPDGSLKNMRVFHNFSPGRSSDGLCMDSAGNLHAAAGLHQRRGPHETLDTKCGIHVFSPEGKLIRFIPIPEDTITNCAFGGKDLKTLYVTAGKGIYQVEVPVPGTRRLISAHCNLQVTCDRMVANQQDANAPMDGLYPYVSVVVPVRNRAHTLPRALRSILAQDYPNFDITVVDGGSTDGSTAIPQQFPKTRVVQQPGKGIADAYNHGIDVTTSPLIAFLSSDDEWTPDKLSTQVAALLAQPTALYSLAFVRYRVEDGVLPPPGFRPELLHGTHPGTMETLLARREAFASVGRFDTQYVTAEDMDWFARARDLCVPTVWVNSPLLTKYVHQSNISHTELSNNASLLKLLAGSIARKKNQAV